MKKNDDLTEVSLKHVENHRHSINTTKNFHRLRNIIVLVCLLEEFSRLNCSQLSVIVENTHIPSRDFTYVLYSEATRRMPKPERVKSMMRIIIIILIIIIVIIRISIVALIN